MKKYPSIAHCNGPVKTEGYIFLKSDGSNIRVEFSKKQGFYKFGTRNRLFDKTDEVFGEAIDLFLQKYGSPLEDVFRKSSRFKNYKENILVFGEFLGNYSFAGHHSKNDPKDIVLFDVNPIKKGFLGPKEFLDEFGHLPVQECIYQGELTEDFIQGVKYQTINVVSNYPIKTKIPEGIVFKSDDFMVKVKTNEWVNAVKEKYGQDWEKVI